MIYLASTSPYRLELLKKTGWPIQTLKPNCDEDSLKNDLLTQNKSPIEIAEVLSVSKGRSLLSDIKLNQNDILISGDQLVSLGNEILGKPHKKEKAIEQLSKLSGKTHELITACTIFKNTEIFHLNHITRFKMKSLSSHEITKYVDLDQPLDCAGSCKIEGHGLLLFERIDCDDFSAIQGLPMIWITNTLRKHHYELFT